MALETNKITLPRSVATVITKKAKDTSTIASLSPSTPQIFSDADYLIFSGSSEAEVIAEGSKKSSYEEELTPVTAHRFKVQTTTRVTSELKWADEDNRLEIISNIQDDQAGAAGRALDYILYHAVSPKDRTDIDGFPKLSDTAIQVTATGNDVSDIDALAEAVSDQYDINGIALSKVWAARLRKLRIPATGMRLYPEIPISLQAGSLDGIRAATSGTVNGRRVPEPTGILAFLGDFSVIKWGLVRNITSEIIEYGDPDNTGNDLKGYNQLAYRTEAVYAAAVLDPNALAVLKEPVEEEEEA